MASIIVLEDGTGKSNSNSYVEADTARDYATNRGYSLPADDAVLEPLLIRAMDYLESRSYKGEKATITQSLQWPRNYVYIDCTLLESNVIPTNLIYAQCRLAVELNEGVDIMPTRTGGFVKSETIGPIKTEYSEKVGTAIEPVLTHVEALLNSIISKAKNYGLRTVRI